MDNVSLSKGIFASKGSYKIGQRKKKVESNFFAYESWYRAFSEHLDIVKNSVEEINSNIFKQILEDLQNYLGDIRDESLDKFRCEIPTAILLTGVNSPDHDILLRKLKSKFSIITQKIAIVSSKDSSNMKSLIEEVVFQIIYNSSEENSYKDLKKSQCTLRSLEAWYFENCDINTPLIIIIPDFESFNATILCDFILVLSSYAKSMKIVLIFGVATTLHAVHRSLSYNVTSKLRVKVFHTPTQNKYLSDVLEGTVLSEKIPFKLTGRAFQLLTDIFLFHDFSVDNFLQGYKLCMHHHFYGNNLSSLCCKRENIPQEIDNLMASDISELKKLQSINGYMKKVFKNEYENIEDERFKNMIVELLNQFHDSINCFFPVLKSLYYLTCTLPGAPMGKQLREVYTIAVTCDLTETQEYKEAMNLLSFMSKDEITLKLKEILKTIITEDKNDLHNVRVDLKNHLKLIHDASLNAASAEVDSVTFDQKTDRRQLQEVLLQLSRKQSQSPFKQAQLHLIKYLDKIFSQYLINPHRLPMSEIFCFSDANVPKHHMKGSLRAAIHTGLNDPQIYLNCSCCKLENETKILSTLPDLSIIYKLHLESRKLINMYDWLQAFLIIVDPNKSDNERKEIDSKLQARFTRAIAELQLLGFIKTTRRKADHVKKLT